MPRNSKEANVGSKTGNFINRMERINSFILKLIKYNEDLDLAKWASLMTLKRAVLWDLKGWRKFQREWENWI